MFEEIIARGFLPLSVLIGFVVFLRCFILLEKKYTHKFFLSMMLLFVLILVDVFNVIEEAKYEATFWHFFVSAVGYACRPFVAYLILSFSEQISKKAFYWLLIPAILNAIVSFVSIPTGWVFSYTETNVFTRGPLCAFPLVCSLIYLFAFLTFALIGLKKRHDTSATFFLFFMCVSLVLAMAIDIFTELRVLNAFLIAAFVLYYMYFLTKQYRFDPLTGALNRKVFYLDSENEREHMSAIVSMDVNGLKTINDTQGHHAGDTALIAISTICKNNLPSNFRFYRIGGDEFVFTCFDALRNEVERCIKRIKEALSEAGYSASFGIAYCSKNESFETVLNKADAEMYVNKQIYKQFGDTESEENDDPNED